MKPSITERLSSLLLVCAVVTATGVGHMKPLGQQGQPLVQVTDIIGEPTVDVFYDHVNNNKPIVMRGVHKSPANNWTLDHILKTYPDCVVRIETKVEKRDIGEFPSEVTIKDFFEKYVKDNYIISQMPEPMYPDFQVPAFMQCAPLKHILIEVNWWVSTGGSKSSLHKDAYNTINCQSEGTKEWILIDHKHARMVPLAKEGGDPYEETAGFSTIKVDKLNLTKHPTMADVPMSRVIMRPGDCLFIPGSYLHQVNSNRSDEKGYNQAYTVLFGGTTQKTPDPKLKLRPGDVCKPKTHFPVETNYRLNDTFIFWSYPGYNASDITMGMGDAYSVISQLAEKADESKNGKLDTPGFVKTLVSLLQKIVKPGLDDRHKHLIGKFKVKDEVKKAVQQAYKLYWKPLAKSGVMSSKELMNSAVYDIRAIQRGFKKYFEIDYFHSLYDDEASTKFTDENFKDDRNEDDEDEEDDDE